MSMDLGELHRLAKRRVQEADRMYTKGRSELVELLASLEGPATMPELIELQPRLTVSSMYRNMTDLETIGVVQKVIGADEHTRYELAEDLIGHHHHHICTECGSVGDFAISPQAERSLDATLRNAVRATGFRPTGHRLDIVGICAACA